MNTDVGLSNYYGAYNASLLIEGKQFFTVQRGETIEIPTADRLLLPDYQRIAELEPDSETLQDTIRQLQSPEVATPQ